MAKILAVDDQLTIRELICAVLKPKGHTVDTAADGNEALKKAENIKYDLIITDINMPNMNGLAFVGKVRQVTHAKYTPILMLTTEHREDVKANARNLGASGWLTKPFDSHRLSSAVKKLLARSEAG